MSATKRHKLSATSSTCLSSINAEDLGKKLGTKPDYLTKDKSSWYLLVENWLPTPSKVVFEEEWNLHPSKRHKLKLFGRVVEEKRWSQSWGMPYTYSGATNEALPIDGSRMVTLLLQKANELVADAINDKRPPYNACLQNWYEPEDTIGLHADDEKANRPEYPILSLSWGGTRRFLFRSKDKTSKKELYLKDGDLLVMGGTCQMTHHHEVPKRRVTMDPPTARRINWTVRAFQNDKK